MSTTGEMGEMGVVGGVGGGGADGAAKSPTTRLKTPTTRHRPSRRAAGAGGVTILTIAAIRGCEKTTTRR